MTPTERAKLIIKSLPEDLSAKLAKELVYWAPEVMLSYVNSFVNTHVPKSASDPVSVRVYAAVCGVSEAVMKIQLALDGYM
jgi:hypothetical protein